MKKKKFDCVQMKHDIQQELMKETGALAANHILGPFLQKIRGLPVFWDLGL